MAISKEILKEIAWIKRNYPIIQGRSHRETLRHIGIPVSEGDEKPLYYEDYFYKIITSLPNGSRRSLPHHRCAPDVVIILLRLYIERAIKQRGLGHLVSSGDSDQQSEQAAS